LGHDIEVVSGDWRVILTLGTSSMSILVTGASGSGTSTLGAALAAELGVSHLDTDDYYWLATRQPFTSKIDRAERLSTLVADLHLKQDAVVAGSVIDWGHDVEDAFDLIVFLYVDASVRVERLKRREIERYGSANPIFLEWAALYDEGPPEGRSLAKHTTWLKERNCPVLELHGNSSVGERVATVLRETRTPRILEKRKSRWAGDSKL
jgi:shikimate kinase